MAKTKSPQDGEKASFLKQDFDINTIKGMFSKVKTKKVDAEVLPDNSSIHYVPSLPEVNMLPASVKETYAAEDLTRKFILGGSTLVVAFAAVWGISLVTDNINQAKLDEMSSATSAYNSEAAALAPYSAYRTSVEGKRSDLASKMGTEVNIAEINNRFTLAAIDAGYEINSLTLSVSGSDAAAAGSCVNPDPFTPASGIGCLNFSLKDNGNGSMTKLFSTLSGKDSGFVNTYIPNAIAGGDGGTVDGSASVTQAFQTNKYESLTLPLDSILDGTAAEKGK